MRKLRVLRAFSCTFLVAAAVTDVVSAAAAEEFYAGKQIRLIVGTDPGGTYDSFARGISRHMGRHIPGEPSIVVQNMPGAAGARAANYIYTVAPRDGTVMGALFSGIATTPLTNPGETKFDPTKFTWIGSATKELYVGYVWHAAKAHSMEAAKTTTVIMGGSAVGTYSVDMAILANAFFGEKFKIVTGYNSGSETQLALERGEVEGVMASALTNLKQQRGQWVEDKKVDIFVQYGLQRNPKLPDVPSFVEFATSDEQRQAIRFITARLDHGRPYLAPPDLPHDRVELLRRAFDATMRDPAFLKEMADLKTDVDGPMTGEELEKFVADEAATPPSVIKMIADALDRFKSQ